MDTEQDLGNISDGYHTFNELYEHRVLLFIALMKVNPIISWRSKLHHDGTMFDDFFIAGMKLPDGDITYHISIEKWELLDNTTVHTVDRGIEWDGHTSDDVLQRLENWIKQ